MISGRKKAFCPKPLRSPDPDHHNRSVIVCTKSPDFKQNQLNQSNIKDNDFNLLTQEITILKH
jgi:hypothetical protein